jgi:CRISPR system Cascade subunit CasE
VTLHLVRLSLKSRALAAFAVRHGVGDDDDGYALHLALRQRYGTAGPQPFRLMEDRDGKASFLAYTTDRDALADAATLPAADPLLDDLLGAEPEFRAMPDTWRIGQRLNFDVRVRPVVRFGARAKAARAASASADLPENWWARAGEVDAWIASRTGPQADQERTREQVYAAWLAGRLEDAAGIEELHLRQYRRVHTHRSTHGKPGKGRRGGVEGPEAVFTGTLAITDPDAFATLLARGIGRHAAFGYGMLLLSPPGRSG